MLANGSASIRCGRDARRSDRGPAIFRDLASPETTALFREKLIQQIHANLARPGVKPRWSKAIFERDLRRYRKRILSEMLRPTPVQRRIEELTWLMARR